MKITRIGKDRDKDIETDTIEVIIGSRHYRLRETKNRFLEINKIESNDDYSLSISVIPICSNEIKIR